MGMLAPSASGDFESWTTLAPTLEPFLGSHVKHFLSWTVANADAVKSGAKELTVDLDGQQWWQTVGGPQKYHVKSLAELRRKYQAVGDRHGLDEVLDRCGCQQAIAGRELAAKL